MRNFLETIGRGLARIIAALFAAMISLAETLIREAAGLASRLIVGAVAGLFELLRPLLPWVAGIAGLAWLNRVEPDLAEGILVLLVLGFVFKMIFVSKKAKK